jgi:hypothetical protein
VASYVPNLLWQFIVTLNLKEGVLDAVRDGYEVGTGVLTVLFFVPMLIGVGLGVISAVVVHRRFLSLTSEGSAMVESHGRPQPRVGPESPLAFRLGRWVRRLLG